MQIYLERNLRERKRNGCIFKCVF